MMIVALITSRKNPNVSNVTGMVNMISKGFTIVFKKAISKAVEIAEKNDSSSTPGSMYDVIITEHVEINIRRINRIKN